MKKPELLLPAGNTETLIAAVEGGADAVYLGLKEFNARGRATNFSIFQLRNAVDYAHKHNVKVYLTLNTVIKNDELSKLIDTIYQVNQVGVDAVIIQDLGVAYIIKNFFKNLSLHASTQAAVHNSLGVNFFAEKGFERVILARELTFDELNKIAQLSRIPIEIFVHGALCYSLSGMCLFSSFLGGQSANRGLCRQPCRRLYQTKEKTGYFFNLKDNSQIENIPKLKKLNIASLKVEGRLKSAEYIYKVAKAYRMVLDDESAIKEAKELIAQDFGREKTAYFLGGKIKNAISKNPYTGIYLGTIKKIKNNIIFFNSTKELKEGYRIRILDSEGRDSEAIKLKDIAYNKQTALYSLKIDNPAHIGEKIFLIGKNDVRFTNKLPKIEGKIKFKFSKKGKIYRKIEEDFKKIKNKKKNLFIRIDNPAWIRKLDFKKFEYLILKTRKTVENSPQKFDLDSKIIVQNKSRIIIQLPKFISEGSIQYYKKSVKEQINKGFRNFMISHISQKDFFVGFAKINLFASEDIYLFNDAAIKFIREEGIKNYIYPFENEYVNLIHGKDRFGIVPLFFVPALFNSRMPVNQIKNDFSDGKGEYKKFIINGITTIVPQTPTALFQFKRKLTDFNNFLIDLSFLSPSKGTLKKLMEKYNSGEAYQPSKTFNFKKGLG